MVDGRWVFFYDLYSTKVFKPCSVFEVRKLCLHLKGFAGDIGAPSREGGAPSRSPQSKMKLGGGNPSAVPLLLLSLAGELSQEFYMRETPTFR